MKQLESCLGVRMTEEEIRRTMEFILEQQAQFAANIQRLQEERAHDGGRVTRLEESFRLLVQLAQSTDSRLNRMYLEPILCRCWKQLLAASSH